MKIRIFLVSLLLIFLAFPITAAQVTYQLTKANYKLFFDGNECKSDLPILMYKKELYVPIKNMKLFSMIDTVVDTKKSSIYLTNKLDTEKINKISSDYFIASSNSYLEPIYVVKVINGDSLLVKDYNDSSYLLENKHASTLKFNNKTSYIGKIGIYDSMVIDKYGELQEFYTEDAD
jgi:hypothetical protein